MFLSKNSYNNKPTLEGLAWLGLALSKVYKSEIWCEIMKKENNHMFKVVSSKAFLNRIKKLSKDHKRRIKKFIEKIERKGIHATKIITSHEDYVLCEMKSKKPPYRLYIVYDQKSKVFYILRWEHKNKQKIIIDKLNQKLKGGIEFGIISIFNDLTQ